MRRFIRNTVLVTSLAMAFTLIACGNKTSNNADVDNTTETKSVEVVKNTETVTETVTKIEKVTNDKGEEETKVVTTVITKEVTVDESGNKVETVVKEETKPVTETTVAEKPTETPTEVAVETPTEAPTESYVEETPTEPEYTPEPEPVVEPEETPEPEPEEEPAPEPSNDYISAVFVDIFGFSRDATNIWKVTWSQLHETPYNYVYYIVNDNNGLTSTVVFDETMNNLVAKYGSGSASTIEERIANGTWYDNICSLIMEEYTWVTKK